MFNRFSLFRNLLILACTSPLFAQAQAGAQLALLDPIRHYFPQPIERFTPGGPEEDETAAKPATVHKPVILFKSARRVSAAFSGYAIELAIAPRPLLQSDPIFKKFGSVQYDLTPDGRYSYLILVPFNSKKSVEAFCNGIVCPKVSEARIVEYKKGKRK